uniref:Uncharacterized protein n=1 Tax=Oryza sativa subsp. japonica TaxID=39947 RepID=Q69RL8_ORYSJ|nr:hypothetical protein [Oryza sativa Japonica Group]
MVVPSPALLGEDPLRLLSLFPLFAASRACLRAGGRRRRPSGRAPSLPAGRPVSRLQLARGRPILLRGDLGRPRGLPVPPASVPLWRHVGATSASRPSWPPRVCHVVRPRTSACVDSVHGAPATRTGGEGGRDGVGSAGVSGCPAAGFTAAQEGTAHCLLRGGDGVRGPRLRPQLSFACGVELKAR